MQGFSDIILDGDTQDIQSESILGGPRSTSICDIMYMISNN